MNFPSSEKSPATASKRGSSSTIHTYFENCNCDSVCPCTTSAFAQPADNERCLPTFAIHVDSGNIDGVGVDGLSAILVFDTPRNMGEGGWLAGLIIDDQASDEQADRLTDDLLESMLKLLNRWRRGRGLPPQGW